MPLLPELEIFAEVHRTIHRPVLADLKADWPLGRFKVQRTAIMLSPKLC